MLLLRGILLVTVMVAVRANEYHECPNLWTSFNGKCYRFFGDGENDEYTWGRAEKHCIHQNGHLASINSKEENDFISWMTSNSADSGEGKRTWIGLGPDFHDQEIHTWADGSSLTFQNWHSGQPDDDGGEDCVDTNFWGRGRWNDADCNEKNNFVCESVRPPLETRRQSRSQRRRQSNKRRCEL